MEKNRYPARDITGCRFSLSVMKDDYVKHIMQTINQVNTEAVWSGTDALSTTYRGRRIHVVDAMRAFFTHANDGKTHVTLEACFSKGCPCDTEADSYLAQDDTLRNPVRKHFDVQAKMAFYPLGILDYMDKIAHVVNLAHTHGLNPQPSHYATALSGDVQVLFDYFDTVLAYAESQIDHYVLQVTLSVNSPTK